MNSQGRKRTARKQGLRKKEPRERRIVNTVKSTGFPDSEIATISYSDEIGLTGSTYAQYTYRGNCVFDPDDTSTGHQPLYYDQYTAVYSKYKVISSKMRVTVSNYSASASTVAVLTPSSEIITVTSYSIAMEQPYSKRTELIPISTRQGAQSSVQSSMSTQKMLGLSAAQFASEDYSALTGAIPTSVWYWNLSFFDIVSVSVRFVVDLEYKVLFYDRRAPSLSLLHKTVKTPEQIEELHKRLRERGMSLETPEALNYVLPVSPTLRSPPPGQSPSFGLPGR